MASPETGAPLPPLPRQPDGVFLDVPAARPAARAVAVAGGVVSLTLPVSQPEVQALVRGYFRALVGGDAAAFRPLLASGARRLEEGAAADLAPALEKRLQRVDYSHLSFESVAAYDELRVIPFEDAPDALRGTQGTREGDVLVDVPMVVQRAGGVRVFGPEVLFVLRRADGGAWQIAAVRETDAPW